ncbi:MAG: riboflavin synthase [Dehalococcoidia bacterium]|nr:riboflavin synthase [Dehalococcoidia bacterium]
MFTGIVEETGSVRATGEETLAVAAQVALKGMHLGDSIAVNGACLTITSMHEGVFTVDLSPETLRRTNLGTLKVGSMVNLERPLAANGRLGGHIVQGHVDGTGQVLEVQFEGNSLLMRFRAPSNVIPYVVEKGFIAVDGVSLTVVRRDASSFTVAVIPFTQQQTILGLRTPGNTVNLEVDILAKYVESLLHREASQPP